MNIEINTKPLTWFLDDFERRQVPYALSNSLNDVAKLFQYREREHIGKNFTVRRKQWVDNSVKIPSGGFATKKKLVATVAIESPGGGKRSDILAKFESTTQKKPRTAPSLFIPVAARKSKTDIIPAGLRPSAFNFKEVGGKRMAGHASHLSNKKMRTGVLRGALKVFEGEKRTVMIRNAQGQGVVLQRVGKGKRAGMRVLFTLAPKARITPNLKFLTNARAAAASFKDFFKARFAEAMHTAKR